MNTDFSKVRYNDNLGYRLLHTKGSHAGESTLDYLHYSLGFMLIYYKQGAGNIKVEGRRYAIETGDMIMINPSELYQFSVDDKLYHERLVLTVTEAVLKDFPYDCSSLFYPFYKRKKGVGNKISAKTAKEFGIDDLMDELLMHISSSDASARAMSFCKTIEILHTLGKAVSPSADSEIDQTSLNPMINEVLNFIDGNFKEDIDIDLIAGNFNIDKSYLSHLFKEHVGMPVWTYVILRRIQRFNELIRKSDSVEECCYSAGFRNYSNFFRLYKKHMNMTPTEFKKQIYSR
ncbi:MAG: helix-turn-helix domain-containing protein [Ruminococcaceae bacterium]|nr:helix-turn-helix domain-containing protein [Oscillospiraceae bacterium]